MLLGEQLEKGLNDQINLEYESFYLYEQLAAFFARSDKALFGFAEYFKKAASEERNHAHELTEIVTKRLGSVILKDVKTGLTSPAAWETSVVALRSALDKEIEVAASFQEIYKTARELKDYDIQDKLDHFVREQVRAIYNVKSLITRLEGKGPAVEYLIDQELLKAPSMHD
ncbi:hypothetical protein Aperf_G00000025517 [Anoplocephala perfoliata]